MPSVQEELEALRRQSLAKNQKAKLNDANGLSTPEQEEQNIKAVKSTTRSSIYKKEAEQVLKAGTTKPGLPQYQMEQMALKKEEQEKRNSTKKMLQNYNSSQTLMDNSNRSVSERAVPAKPTTNDEEKKSDDPPLPEHVEEVPKVEQEEEEVPQLPVEHDGGPDVPAVQRNGSRPPNRAEKKARKQMERLGMKPVPDIARVTLKRREGFFTIHNPDVYEKNGTFMVFGEARAGTGLFPQEQKAAQAAQQFSPLMQEMEEKKQDRPHKQEDKTSPVTPDVNLDESGLDPKDIELVISQVGCSRAKAVHALKLNAGDLVNAIMSLTS